MGSWAQAFLASSGPRARRIHLPGFEPYPLADTSSNLAVKSVSTAEELPYKVNAIGPVTSNSLSKAGVV